MKLEIMDTSLRDGEQTSGVSYTDTEKLNIARVLLDEAKVDRIEIASARVSDGEFKAVEKIIKWAESAGHIDKIEVLGFIDDKESLKWLANAGAKVINLLAKGSEKHCRLQLRNTPEEHINNIKQSLIYAREMGIASNIYLEDWSNGMVNSPEYVYNFIDALKDENIKRFMLPDTLGILNPEQTYNFCKDLIDRYPGLHFDFHAHNDYDLAGGNVFMALKAGIQGVHTTVNGLGERAGNVPLSTVVAIINDHFDIVINVVEAKLTLVSNLVETFSGIRIPANKPIIGDFVFTQTSGIHADGDSKSQLYFNDLLPERFGREREYALGKLSGKASIKNNLEALGINLDLDEMKKVTNRIIELGDKKEVITQSDLPYIISDVLRSKRISEIIQVVNYNLSVADGLNSVATLKLKIGEDEFQETSSGYGQYDAFMKALWKIYDNLGKSHPILIDYLVTIPPGGKTDALVQAKIIWEYEGKNIKTIGLDPDQTVAAIKGTVKMLNIIENGKNQN